MMYPFEIKTGEILGVAGVAGSGQKELCETLTGLMTAKKERSCIIRKTSWARLRRRS